MWPNRFSLGKVIVLIHERVKIVYWGQFLTCRSLYLEILCADVCAILYI